MSPSPDVAPVSTELQEVVRASLDRWGVPGAAIGVLNEGRTSVGAVGVASLETNQPVTPQTLFRVASITKPFTATLAMTLVNDGLLDPDRPVRAYLPGVALTYSDADWQRQITMRHLLSHTAGLDSELTVDLASFGQGDDALGNAVASYGSRLRQWEAPGQVMSYGNTGFWLAGHLIATLADSSYEDAMRERVLRPLGLERSVFTADEAIVHPVALGHQPTTPTDDAHELIPSYGYPRARRPSGGLISTVVDLLEFARWHLGQSDRPLSLSAELRDAMQVPVIRLRESDNEAWGLGWNLSETADGTRTIGHGGSFGGFQTRMTIVPSRKFAYVMLTNSARGGLACREVERFAMERACGLALLDPTPIRRDRSNLTPFEGSWQQPLATHEIAVVDDAHGAWLELTSHERGLDGKALPVPPPVRMSAVGDHEFLALDGVSKGVRADFIRDPAGGAPRRVRVGLEIAERATTAGS